MERRLNITYRIHPVSGGDVPDDHKEDLEVLALDQISSMLEQGYREGELFSNLRITTGAIPYEISEVYKGHWQCEFVGFDGN
ncbi:hypothetical protein [Halomonas sp. KO116]|uniref:hypothetical protein n=1 Tax=Halomonas sp. KO116 TaxID=1504981 RepID=UPI0004E3BEBD|nr:hypothetical protein [Halomonas sp. KO116]AJY53178.1 hypothetical protein KO116_P200071 [Halomonas sp. KO116]